MRHSNTIIDSLIELVNNDLSTEYTFSAVRAFETKSLPIPLTEIFLSFTCESQKVSYFENENTEYCQKNEVVVRVNCFSPLSHPAHTSHNIAEAVFDYISDNYPESATSFSIGTTEYDSDIRAYKLTGYITFVYEECAGEGAVSDPIATPKNFFCKTHVLDSDIHINAYERELLTEAFVTGTYDGTGSGTQEIAVGFPPRFVIIYPTNVHTSVYDSSSQKTTCYTGYGFSSSVSKAVTTTYTGFRVKNVTETSGDTKLNAQRVSYAYAVFK